MKKVVITLILGIFLISLLSFTSAEQRTLGTFETNSAVNLTQICSNCTFNNISSIISPNSAKILSNVEMTKDGTFYNYTFNGDTSVNGEYIVNGVGDLDGINTIWTYNFFINPNGTPLTEAESKIYTMIIFILLISIGILIFFIIILPSENIKGPEGQVMGIVNLKYVRIMFIAILYLLLIVILNLMNGLLTNFANLEMFANVIGFLFQTMLRLAWPFTIIIIFWIVYNLVVDTNWKKAYDTALDPLGGVW